STSVQTEARMTATRGPHPSCGKCSLVCLSMVCVPKPNAEVSIALAHAQRGWVVREKCGPPSCMKKDDGFVVADATALDVIHESVHRLAGIDGVQKHPLVLRNKSDRLATAVGDRSIARSHVAFFNVELRCLRRAAQPE